MTFERFEIPVQRGARLRRLRTISRDSAAGDTRHREVSEITGVWNELLSRINVQLD